MPPRRRAMTPTQASDVKQSGHRNELDFASVIGGQINPGNPRDKKDVIDARQRSYSVKAGVYWQVFLYGRERLRTNTVFQGMGRIADIMVACIDAYPSSYAGYQANKSAAKQRLQPHMRSLLAELQKPGLFESFLNKALFDDNDADYLSVFLGKASIPKSSKQFHIFHKDEVVKALVADVTLRNSKARGPGQMDDQKVTLLSSLHNANIGEIEDRHDSADHYQQMKFRLHGASVFAILTNRIKRQHSPRPQITTYGKATRLFR